MKEYEKPIIEDEDVEFENIVCVSQGNETKDGQTFNFGDF